MKKQFLSLLVICSLFFTGCDYIVQMMLPAPVAAIDKEPTEKMDWINETNEATLNILLLPENKVYYYFGDDIKDGKLAGYAKENNVADGIVYGYTKFGDKMQIIVKETDRSNPDNLDIMLELLKIMQVKKYLLADPTKREQALVDDIEY